MVQTTWKGSSALGTESQLSIILSATGTQRWGGGLEVTVWAGRSWQPSALTPCLTPPVEKCWQTDSRDVKLGEWRRRKERKREPTSGACRSTCPTLFSRQQLKHAASSNLQRWPTATLKYHQTICNIQQPLHSVEGVSLMFQWGKNRTQLLNIF